MDNDVERADRRANLLRKIDEGLQALEAGNYVELDDDSLSLYFEELKVRGRQRRKETQ